MLIKIGMKYILLLNFIILLFGRYPCSKGVIDFKELISQNGYYSHEIDDGTIYFNICEPVILQPDELLYNIVLEKENKTYEYYSYVSTQKITLDKENEQVIFSYRQPMVLNNKFSYITVKCSKKKEVEFLSYSKSEDGTINIEMKSPVACIKKYESIGS